MNLRSRKALRKYKYHYKIQISSIYNPSIIIEKYDTDLTQLDYKYGWEANNKTLSFIIDVVVDDKSKLEDLLTTFIKDCEQSYSVLQYWKADILSVNEEIVEDENEKIVRDIVPTVALRRRMH